jgi:glycosyltransferase involved in cell wall biosynthesis
MIHGRPVPAPGEAPAATRAAWGAVLAAAYRRAGAVLVVSAALAGELARLVRVRDAIAIPAGVAVPSAVPPEPPVPAHGFLGRLAPEKGPDTFLEVARELPGRPALVFGDGPLRARLEAAAPAHVRFAGWTDREAALAALAVLVLPSRREALGLSLL